MISESLLFSTKMLHLITPAQEYEKILGEAKRIFPQTNIDEAVRRAKEKAPTSTLSFNDLLWNELYKSKQ